MAEDHPEMRITPKFYESLKERRAAEFELTAFTYLEPAAQVMTMILIDDEMEIGEALNRLANRQRDLGR